MGIGSKITKHKLIPVDFGIDFTEIRTETRLIEFRVKTW